ncbi:hypothetical protein CEXT_320141 [Caerostris extrusa]|uniref:Uncharacterized protein n=1 Tax=Caerostris extrusa TaxID=172846 RepID=A0AAV4WYP4_CAEEX|nr:hypothetical protein CEXT_320141 [Caerostris extrusa]
MLFGGFVHLNAEYLILYVMICHLSQSFSIFVEDGVCLSMLFQRFAQVFKQAHIVPGVWRGRGSWIDERSSLSFCNCLPPLSWGGLKQFQVISFRYADAYLMRFRDIKIENPSSILPPTPLTTCPFGIFHVKDGGFSGSVSVRPMTLWVKSGKWAFETPHSAS